MSLPGLKDLDPSLPRPGNEQSKPPDKEALRHRESITQMETVIQWTWRQLPDGTWIKGYSWNPWWGCQKVSEECHHCYAQGIAHHYGHAVWGPAATTPRRLFGPAHWQEPLRWNRQAEQAGHRRSV